MNSIDDPVLDKVTRRYLIESELDRKLRVAESALIMDGFIPATVKIDADHQKVAGVGP